MAQSSGTTSCLGCLGTLFFIVFVVPSIISGLFAVFRGEASLGIKNCSFNITNGSFSCKPEITAKYQFLDITNLKIKQDKITAAIQKFHAQVNQADCLSVYEQSSETFQKANSLPHFLMYCDAIQRNSGRTSAFEILGWEWLPSDHQANEFIRVHLWVHGQRSNREELLVWQMHGPNVQLVSHAYGLIPTQFGGR
ncbi:hypothetical protein [Thermoleptolyngbya sp. M55_K2018_002]|uniref:hypothetical protein n=1 Tax=Thermoleptolyngbya sp. M55_K2018_002 TaxID=2747808 RepID=UPI0019FF0BFC|nr:hypothetical protein [Thermoleptolyngbya sp. M55_K2018_002]HIK41555.1 hypothetical protein [Thermoleptolyngbya sp. M55_K2018_002]